MTSISRLARDEALAKLSDICLRNAEALLSALDYCTAHGIGAFRVNSQILPVKTHPEVGYEVGELPAGEEIKRKFKECGSFARKHGIRTLFHPDQFVVLSSVDEALTARSIGELKYQAQVAGWIHADVINIHGGGAYGDKEAALARVETAIKSLPAAVRKRLTLENDDRVYTPSDLLPLCRRTKVPMIYDVHHHRCLPDVLTEEEAAQQALETWDREPVFHLSSPREGWTGPKPSRHHDYINIKDLPESWKDLDITVEIEAKAKEQAIMRLARQLEAASRGAAKR